MNLKDTINHGQKVLKNNNIISSKLDSEILLSEVIKKDRKYIILNLEKKINDEHLKKFKDLINLRSRGKPVAYITGKKNFWKNEFIVTEGVLIPRPDTELIIEQVIKITKQKSKLKILDIGVGSGCILLSILKEKKDFYGIGIDLSKKCIDLSKINASNLELTNRVKFFKSNVDNFFYGKYDLIISNPPYIKKLDLKYLDKDVISYEPNLALDGGLEGISEIRKVIDRSSDLLKRNGKLILEIAFDQKEKVTKLLKKRRFYINNILKDFAKNDRCIISTKI
tara:strand:- start:1958 stop:2800 length:843 start_codon:yes stop_codon:yes gene_type:complete